MTNVELFYRFGIALALGLLVGLEREYSHADEGQTPLFGGARTFPLIALTGCAAALIASEVTPWFFPVAFAAVTGLVMAAYAATAAKGDVGLTTEVTSLVVFLCGALAYWDYLLLAAAVTVTTLALLSLKTTLHDLSRRISRQDIYATLKFAIITVIILPLLPNRTYGPLDVLNPQQIWLMVVFISGISFCGYVLIKLVGPRQGIGLTGLLGGLVSSTAVTLSFSQRSQKASHLARPFTLAITVASTTMFIRVLFEAFVLNPALARVLAIPLLAAAGVGLAACAYLWFTEHTSEQGEVAVSNPFELGPAIKFGLLFAVILFISKAAQAYLGNAGVYLSSIVAGLTDVDAITLSMTRLASEATISHVTAARAIVLAAMSNTAVKAGIVATMGASSLRRHVLPTFAVILITGVVIAFLAG
ncbi:MAG: MgtC/SapB family protein [Chloroflexi bacterium]|nr:MAG: MgtC/SapB family protein [Chloroflexota bacterium]